MGNFLYLSSDKPLAAYSPGMTRTPWSAKCVFIFWNSPLAHGSLAHESRLLGHCLPGRPAVAAAIDAGARVRDALEGEASERIDGTNAGRNGARPRGQAWD